MGDGLYGVKRLPQRDLDVLFERASEKWEEGKLISAFRLLLAGAKGGDYSSQLNLGTFYSDGIGVQRNNEKALYWYRRAYGRGDGAAATNIAIVYRDENRLNEALAWFKRAVKWKDADANLEIAKIHLSMGDGAAAVPFLERVLKAGAEYVTSASKEEAKRLLKNLV